VEPVLKENTSFTTDEIISLDYQELADTTQPTGNGVGFTRVDLTKFIGSTENKYCLMIPKDGWLQVFHSAFVSDEWVYASTSCSGVDDCWMRIPVKSLLNPMKSLDLNLWQEKGVPVARRKLPTFRGLTNKSRSLPKFLDKNKLIEVPMDVAKTLPVRPVPSSFQEPCTEFWLSMRDPRKMTRVFPWHHTIHYKHCNNLVVPPVWTQNLIISFIS